MGFKHAPISLSVATAVVFAVLGALVAAPATPTTKTTLKQDGTTQWPSMNLPPAPPLTVEQEMATFKLPPGLQIQCVAHEPMVEDPVAMTWDADGRLWVVEMRGYMPDIDGNGEDQPVGRVVILKDSTGSGAYDKRTVFLDGLVLPRAITLVKGGVLIGAPPHIFFCTINSNLTCGEKRIVLSDYGQATGSPEVLANGLHHCIDNWIYNASYPWRLKWDGSKLIREPYSIGGQWGIAQDDTGRLYFNSSTQHLRGNRFPTEYAARNPRYRCASAVNVRLSEDERTFPGHKTATNRAYMPEEVNLQTGALKRFTAACGPTIYRGSSLGIEYAGNAFSCEPAGNFIRRDEFIRDDVDVVTAHNPYEKDEFLTSSDPRFRPVNLYTGPDDALYVVDLYRGLLQHGSDLTDYLRRETQQSKLDGPPHLGRIWRIIPNAEPHRGPAIRSGLTGKKPADLVAFLASPNAWMRDTAQRLIVETGDPSAAPLLRAILKYHAEPLQELHALWTLDGLGKVDADVLSNALASLHPDVRAAAIRLAEPDLRLGPKSLLMPKVLALANDASFATRLQFVLTVSAINAPEAEHLVVSLLIRHADNPVLRDAAISGLAGREAQVLDQLLAAESWTPEAPGRAEMLTGLAGCIYSAGHPGAVKHLLETTAAQPDAWRQLALLDGMAPPPVKDPKLTAGPAAPEIRRIELDAEPPALALLLKSDDPEIHERVTRLAPNIVWPGKPGVVERPPAPPLSPAE